MKATPYFHSQDLLGNMDEKTDVQKDWIHISGPFEIQYARIMSGVNRANEIVSIEGTHSLQYGTT